MMISKVEDFIEEIFNIKNIRQKWDTEIIIENNYYSIQVGVLYIKKIYEEEGWLWLTTDDDRIFNLKLNEDTEYRIIKRLG